MRSLEGPKPSRLELEYLAAVSLCKIVSSHGMEKWTGCPVVQAHEARHARPTLFHMRPWRGPKPLRRCLKNIGRWSG